MTKNQKLAVGVSSSLLVVILIVLSLVSSADPIVTNPQPLCAENTWIKRADFSGNPVSFANAFSIGKFGYVGMGQSNDLAPQKSFWQYNPSTNSWTKKADYGGEAKRRSVGFAIGQKGYIGVDHSYKDFWEWDQATDIWTKKADFSSYKRDFAVGFSIGNKGYIGTGGIDIQGYTNPVYKDFWEFNPAGGTDGSGSWTQKADYGGGFVTKAVGFSIGNKGYIGTGILADYNTSTLKKDFWEYNSKLNTWTRKADFGGGARFHSVGFSMSDKGYIGTGRASSYPGILYLKDFWEYSPVSDTWTRKADFGGKARLGAIGFSIDGFGYLGTGQGSEGQASNYKDFWKYCPGVIN